MNNTKEKHLKIDDIYLSKKIIGDIKDIELLKNLREDLKEEMDNIIFYILVENVMEKLRNKKMKNFFIGTLLYIKNKELLPKYFGYVIENYLLKIKEE